MYESARRNTRFSYLIGSWDAWFSFSWPFITLGLVENDQDLQAPERDEAAQAVPIEVHIEDDGQRPQQESRDDDEIRIEHYGSGLRDCRIGR